MNIRARQKMPKVPEPYSNRQCDIEHEEPEKKNDFMNICLLMFLYVMQGIPLGLASSVPLIIQSSSKTASFSNQGTFSLAIWPFSLKLLWAPIVDSIYSTRFGRRKCWLIPTQYAIGINLLVLATHVDEWLGRAPGNPWGPLGVTHSVDIVQLTIAFFGLTMLAATQDIAVDGWALTMLSKKNLGWASTCNTVGQNFGNVVTYTLLLSLESPEICNTYLRFTPVEGQGLISYSGFLYFWGIVFLVTTTIVAVLKHEVNSTVTQPVQACLIRMSDKLPFASKACCRSNGNNTSASTRSRLRLRRQRNRLEGNKEEVVFLDPSAQEDEEPQPVDAESVCLLSDHRSATATVSTTTTTTGIDGSRLDNVFEVRVADPSPDEDAQSMASNDELSMLDTYRVMVGVLQLKPIILYILMLFAAKISFSAVDAITTLKLIECGVTKERLAFLQILLYPFHAVLPLMIVRWTNGPRPLNFFCLAMLPRLVVGCLWVPVIYFSPAFQVTSPGNRSSSISLVANLSSQPWNASSFSSSSSGVESTTFLWSFYAVIVFITTVYSVFATAMSVSMMAFHARISDPSVGGTYMTLVNTASNMAGMLPSTLAYYLMEPLSVRSCFEPDVLAAGQMSWRDLTDGVSDPARSPPPKKKLMELGQRWLDLKATCDQPRGIKACESAGGTCHTFVDGYYVEVFACFIIGLIMLPTVVRPLVRRLDALPTSAYAFRLPAKTCKCSGSKWFRWWPFSSRSRRPRKSSNDE